MYTVYKITNTINNKYYIGVHKTQNPNDLYFGNGAAIKQAIKKYKKENFTKFVEPKEVKQIKEGNFQKNIKTRYANQF